MPTVTRQRLHHLALTVTDVDASVHWYEDVFGVHFLMDAPHKGGVGKVLADEGHELMIVLHHHDSNGGGPSAKRPPGSTTPASLSQAAAISNTGKTTSRRKASPESTWPTNR